MELGFTDRSSGCPPGRSQVKRGSNRGPRTMGSGIGAGAHRALFAAPLLLLALGTPAHAGPLFSSMFGTFATGQEPWGLCVDDPNSDGRPDLITSNFGVDPDYVGTVSVLLSNGDGTFGAHAEFDAGSGPRSVAAGNLDADGRLDLAVVNSNA